MRNLRLVMALAASCVFFGCVAPGKMDPGYQSPPINSEVGYLSFERLPGDYRLWLWVANQRTRYSFDGVQGNPVTVQLTHPLSRGTMMIADVPQANCGNRPMIVSITSPRARPSWMWLGECGSVFRVSGSDRRGLTLVENRAGQEVWWNVDNNGNVENVAPPPQITEAVRSGRRVEDATDQRSTTTPPPTTTPPRRRAPIPTVPVPERRPQ